METRESMLDLERLVGEGGNASLPEIDVTLDPDFKLVTLSRDTIATIEGALRVCLDHSTHTPELAEKLTEALMELKKS